MTVFWHSFRIRRTNSLAGSQRKPPSLSTRIHPNLQTRRGNWKIRWWLQNSVNSERGKGDLQHSRQAVISARRRSRSGGLSKYPKIDRVKRVNTNKQSIWERWLVWSSGWAPSERGSIARRTRRTLWPIQCGSSRARIVIRTPRNCSA